MLETNLRRHVNNIANDSDRKLEVGTVENYLKIFYLFYIFREQKLIQIVNCSTLYNFQQLSTVLQIL